MRRFSGILWVAMTLGVGLCWMVCRSVRDEAATHAATDAPGASRSELSAEVAPAQLAELRRELAALRHELAAQGRRTAGASIDMSTRTRPSRTDTDVRAEYERARREAIAGVDAAFRGEARDPRWSATASSAIQTALATDDKLRPLAREIECRSQTCRVEIAEDGAGELDRMLPDIVLRVGRDLPSALYDRAQGADGTTHQIIYLSRPST
jgi:hypothetical protein